MRLQRNKPAPAGRRRQPGGEQSPAAFSYYARRSPDRQNVGRETGRQPAAANTGTSLWRGLAERGGLLLLVLAIAAGTIHSLGVSYTPRIVQLGGSDAVLLHSTSEYATAATDILNDSIWNRNKITINTKAVSQKLKAEFPELADVSMTLPLLAQRPVIYLQPSQPVLVLQTSSGGYVIGQNGTALLPTIQLPNSLALELPVVDDQTGVSVHTGQRALSSTDVAFIQMVVAQLKAAHIKTGELTLPPGTSELDVRLAGKPYYAKFNLHASLDSARQQAGTLIAVKRKLESKQLTPHKYIDVRVEGRAYYR